MGSPAATAPPLSSSTPDLRSKTLMISGRSSASTSNRPTKFSYWTSWSNINKLGDYIIPRPRSNDSDLTEGSLDAHNKLHGIPHKQAHISNFIFNSVEDKNSKCSPYYKGLVDATLALNREKNTAGGDSPGRESHSTVFSSVSGSLSSFLGKVQDLGTTCFACRKTGKNHHPSPLAHPPNSLIPTYSSSNYSKEIKLEKNHPDVPLVDEEKPLKERVFQPEPPAPIILPPPQTVVSSKNGEEKQVDIQNLNQKFTLADKYRPKALKDFLCNRSEAIRLQDLVKYGGCDHVIFEGPPGVGKRTMIWAMLREAFGPDRVQTRDECKVFDLKGESIGKIRVNLRESSKHVEVNLSDVRGYEKHVIVELMKETQSNASKSNKPFSSFSDNCRAIILCEADKLSTDVLLYIRWLLERYKGDNKVIFCSSDVSKLQPIRSLCTLIQLLPPSKDEIVQVLEFIAMQEGIHLPHKLAEKMANSSKNNLRQAIRSFEACWQWSYPFEEDQIILTGWEEDIVNIAKNVVEERSPKQLYIIRGKLQTLIEHDLSPYFIFKSLVEELKKHLHLNLHPQVDDLYDEYNRDDESMIESEDEMCSKGADSVRKNMRIFLRIEEFIARFMSWYNNQSKMAAHAHPPTLQIKQW